MSGYAYLAIRCDADGCYAETHTPGHVDTYSEVRRIRRESGWRTRRAPGRLLALCPDHATEASR
ncbi:hypothetical protein E1265_35700 [Streptomyces sp. 8K308]|uniref:hypothetical protein n=1 Tax=Streptomyces sp. 8K308 TaxID=2530388 RepID=UPI001053FC8B|nr:hypothetical protein [Streptomyces sp. 8K308]TDC04970.1 hypothetical protein E1265_35700 [Streptomyces sp. 8K308]